MKTKVDSFVSFNNIQVRFDAFIEVWADYSGHTIKRLPFKCDLRYWNDGPTSMQPKETVALMSYSRHDGEQCIGVYEMWQRADGFTFEVYKFDSLEDYNSYSPSQDSPDAISREIGLCSNYHKGI